MLTPPAALHALLFASGEPLSKAEAAQLLGVTPVQLSVTIAELSKNLAHSGVALIETDTEIELRTSPEAAALVKQFRESELSRDLGKASLETLSVIAYQEGATRGEIDWVRGVNSSASVRTLQLRGLIHGTEDEADKRRIRYRITPEALAHLGVSSVRELPRFDELASAATDIITAEAAAAESDHESA